jgi:integrase
MKDSDMATIRQQKNGRWQAIIRRRDSASRSKTFSTKERALIWARLIESEIDRGIYIDRTASEQITISDIISRYQNEITPLKRSASKEISRLRMLNQFFGRIILAKLHSPMIALYRDTRIKHGASGSTVIKDLNTLSHIIDTAMKEWGFSLPSNPVKNIRKPRANKGRDRRLNFDEEMILLNACRAHSIMMESVVIIAIETAMRLGEIINLNWDNVELEKRVVTLYLTKNGDVRRVPLSTRAIYVLSNLPRQINNSRCFWRWKSAASFESSWQRILKRSELNNFRFHDLRHEAASRLFERNLNVMEVATITGHRSLQMLKRYTHLKAEDLVRKLN